MHIPQHFGHKRHHVIRTDNILARGSFKQFLSKRSIQSCLEFLANRFCNFFLCLPLQVKILGNGNSSQNAKEYEHWDEGTKNGPDKSALLGHNFVYQETKPHGFYSSYFHQRISS